MHETRVGFELLIALMGVELSRIMNDEFGRRQLFTQFDSLGLGLILGAIPNWEGLGLNNNIKKVRKEIYIDRYRLVI